MSSTAQRLDPDEIDEETEQLRVAVEEARAAVRRGEHVSHERVREWLLALAAGERPPPPLP